MTTTNPTETRVIRQGDDIQVNHEVFSVFTVWPPLGELAITNVLYKVPSSKHETIEDNPVIDKLSVLKSKNGELESLLLRAIEIESVPSHKLAVM